MVEELRLENQRLRLLGQQQQPQEQRLPQKLTNAQTMQLQQEWQLSQQKMTNARIMVTNESRMGLASFTTSSAAVSMAQFDAAGSSSAGVKRPISMVVTGNEDEKGTAQSTPFMSSVVAGKTAILPGIADTPNRELFPLHILPEYTFHQNIWDPSQNVVFPPFSVDAMAPQRYSADGNIAPAATGDNTSQGLNSASVLHPDWVTTATARRIFPADNTYKRYKNARAYELIQGGMNASDADKEVNSEWAEHKANNPKKTKH